MYDSFKNELPWDDEELEQFQTNPETRDDEETDDDEENDEENDEDEEDNRDKRGGDKYKPGTILGEVTDEEWELFQGAVKMCDRMTNELSYKTTCLSAMRTLWWAGIRQRLGLEGSKVPLEFDPKSKKIKVSQKKSIMDELRNIIRK